MEDDDSDPALESSVLDRLLAQTAQRLDSISPEIENDESGTQSLDGNLDGVDGDGDEEEDLKIKDEDEVEEDGPEKVKSQSEAMAMLKEAISAQSQQQAQQAQQVQQVQQTPQKPSVESLIAANQARFAHHLAAQLTGMSSMLNGARKSEEAAIPPLRPSTPPPTASTTSHFHPYKEAARNRHRQQTADNVMRYHLQQVSGFGTFGKKNFFRKDRDFPGFFGDF